LPRTARRRLAVATALATLAGSASAAPETFRDEAHHWSIQVPSDWQRCADDEARALGSGSSRVTQVVAAFRGKTDDVTLLALWHDRATTGTFDDLERSLDAHADAFASLHASASKLGERLPRVGAPVLDRDRGRWSFTANGDRAALFVSCLGNRGDAVFVCSAPSSDAKRLRPQVKETIDSFSFDSGHAFDEDDNRLLAWVLGGVSALFVALKLAVKRLEAKAHRLAEQARLMQRG
jgi:hypothetical protein